MIFFCLGVASNDANRENAFHRTLFVHRATEKGAESFLMGSTDREQRAGDGRFPHFRISAIQLQRNLSLTETRQSSVEQQEMSVEIFFISLS
jgi:hypothetical protein